MASHSCQKVQTRLRVASRASLPVQLFPTTLNMIWMPCRTLSGTCGFGSVDICSSVPSSWNAPTSTPFSGWLPWKLFFWELTKHCMFWGNFSWPPPRRIYAFSFTSSLNPLSRHLCIFNSHVCLLVWISWLSCALLEDSLSCLISLRVPCMHLAQCLADSRLFLNIH